MFRPGDVIQDYETPFVIHLNLLFKEERCSKCLKVHRRNPQGRIITVRCEQCPVFTYCSTSCRSADWDTVHKVECSAYNGNRYDTIIVDDVRAQVVRLASLLQLNGEIAETRFKHYDGNYR